MTIVDFLLARIAEDEAVVSLDHADTFRHAIEDAYVAEGYPDPARVLAECQAKRAIIALHTYEWMGPDDAAGKGCEHDYEDWPCPTLRHLAAVYADHPDYQPDWRP